MKSNTLYLNRNLVVLMGAFVFLPMVSVAAVTDLSDAPLSSGIGGSTIVKPNIAFVFDDSGSMDDQNMPGNESTDRSSRCWGWYKYNTIFYNPGYTYKPPFKLDGAAYSDGVNRFPDASFTAALKDGYFASGGYTYAGNSTSNSTTNLSTLSNLTPNTVSCTATSECPSSPSKYYYSTNTANPNSSSCESNNNYTIVTDAAKIGAPGVPATGRTAAEIAAAKTNYANWYTYYRSRAMLMKAGTGEAFKDLDESKYRIGLFFLNSVESESNGTTSHNNNDFKIDDFSGSASGTQRYDWYSKLYGARSDTYTPTRGALSRMGRMFAGQISGWDPVQYSCQQNFAIVSTDGFWNTNYESGSYGPKQIDGSTNVGNTDFGQVAAVGANATIVTDGSFGSSRCYEANSLTIDIGTGGTPNVVELLNATPVVSSCTGNASARADAFGVAVAASINANSATGFSALYSASSNTLTITAPGSLGNFTGTQVLTKTLTGGSGSESFTINAFAGGVAAQSGIGVPYKDIYGVSNSLADIAYYYYTTDLRTSALSNCVNTIGGTTYSSLCTDNVLGSGKDTNSQQHMTTFTVGLGVSGTITYESNYETAPDISGVTQYYDIVNGTANWPNTGTDAKKIDDLWHAAVNGRGTYYSASDAATLTSGLQSALAGVQARTGSSAAAATSNLEPVAGDNFVYVALYRTQYWDGDLKAFEIDPDTGALTGTALWSAQEKLDGQVAAAGAGADGRTIKYFSSGGTNKLKDFTSANLTTDSLVTYFQNLCTDAAKVPRVDQCGADGDDLTGAQQTVANTAANLINYLRGQSTYEDEASNATAANKLYRGREHVLGDTVNAVPVYMQKPPFSYDQYDATYATFKTTHASRVPTVFVAANDGMLHAFNATSDSTATAEYANRGKERWAYVPRAVMPNMWKLSDRDYPDNHRYFVDGSPTVADICTLLKASNNQLCKTASDWKTVVIGGLNKGGCSYYALDVTDPTTPKGLWEFTNANLGYTFGNPVVGKKKDGTWVVIFASGYNNYPSNGCGATGDGNGHVFVVDAATGVLLEDIVTYTSGSTPAGTTTTPSGLAKLNAWIDNADLPVIDRLYGGDMLGNLWRIDFDDNHLPAAAVPPATVTSGKEAVLLAHLYQGANAQPITTKPELAEITANNTQYAVVMVGTGKYMGSGDLSDTNQQTIYSIKDSLTATGVSDVRGVNMASRTLTQTTGTTGELLGRTIRTISGNTVNWSSQDGWYLDLNPGNTSPGERVNVDMSLQYNILTVAANVPSNNACEVGGSAYLYFLDIDSGKNLTSSTESMAGVRLSGNALVAGIKTLKLSSGKTVTVITDTAGGVGSESNPSATSGGAGTIRRSTWREIAD